MPGGGAEILVQEIRKQICGQKESGEEWLSVHKAAHKLGIPTNATMLFGHIESGIVFGQCGNCYALLNGCAVPEKRRIHFARRT
ncbi:hypothetical protein R83H12_02669 [Fibrobacteria bacterium R8-3-H12]